MRRFPIRLDQRYRWFLRLFGVNEGNAWVDLEEADLDARFGWFAARTPLANVTRWRIEGPWRAITALGIRRSIRHADVTFGGTPSGGIRLDFAEPVRFTFFTMPALYLTLEDLEGFAAELSERGIPGEDARTRIET